MHAVLRRGDRRCVLPLRPHGVLPNLRKSARGETTVHWLRENERAGFVFIFLIIFSEQISCAMMKMMSQNVLFCPQPKTLSLLSQRSERKSKLSHFLFKIITDQFIIKIFAAGIHSKQPFD